jgi:hypothetical protein
LRIEKDKTMITNPIFRRSWLAVVLCLSVFSFSFGCGDADDDDDSGSDDVNDDDADDDDSISDDDADTSPESQQCPPPDDSYDGVGCDYVDDFFFRENWMDFSQSWPSCPWEFETTGDAFLKLIDTEELIPPDEFLERNLHIAAIAPEAQGGVTISRVTPPPDCEFNLWGDFTLNFRAGGVFTIGLGSTDPLQRAVAVFDAREEPPTLFGRNSAGELLDCGTFPVGEWLRVNMDVEGSEYDLTVRRSLDFYDITAQCFGIPWRNDAAPEFLGGIVMETGPNDGALVDVNFLIFDRDWPDEP